MTVNVFAVPGSYTLEKPHRVPTDKHSLLRRLSRISRSRRGRIRPLRLPHPNPVRPWQGPYHLPPPLQTSLARRRHWPLHLLSHRRWHDRRLLRLRRRRLFQHRGLLGRFIRDLRELGDRRPGCGVTQSKQDEGEVGGEVGKGDGQ